MVVQTRSKTKALLTLQNKAANEKMFKALNLNIRRRRNARQIVEIPAANIGESSDSEADPDYDPRDEPIHQVVRPVVRPIIFPTIEPVQPVINPPTSIRNRISFNAAIRIFQLVFYVFCIIVFAIVLYQLYTSASEETIVVRRRWF